MLDSIPSLPRTFPYLELCVCLSVCVCVCGTVTKLMQNSINASIRAHDE